MHDLRNISTNYLYYAVPGPPIALTAEPSLQDCTQAILRWSPPAPDERNGNIMMNLDMNSQSNWSIAKAS